MHRPTCLLQGFQGQFRSLGISTFTKASTTNQTHQCVLPSLLRARALKEDQDLPHWDQGTNCGHFDKGASTEHLLPTLQIHVWTVTQDALVKDCEVNCTTALTLQPFLEGESVLFLFFNHHWKWTRIFFVFNPKSSARVFARYPFWDFTWIKLKVSSLFSQKILVHLEFDCTQNLNVMAPELPTHQLSVEWTLE